LLVSPSLSGGIESAGSRCASGRTRLVWEAPMKIRATVKVIGGPVYRAHQINRLCYKPKNESEGDEIAE
jgi:hypothetical protein